MKSEQKKLAEKCCVVCSKTFTPRSSTQKVCCAECRKIWNKKIAEQYKLKRRVDSIPSVYLYKYKETKFDKKLKKLKTEGKDYAEEQKKETIEMFARIKL